jgi:transmembrane sensor
MSNVSQLNSHRYAKEQIQEQACLWISRIDRGLSLSERQGLVAWCNQDNNHHKTLLAMASHWDDLSVLSELRGLFPLEKAPKKLNKKFSIYAVAASLALFSLLGASYINDEHLSLFFPFINHSQKVVQVFETSIGEQTRFVMPDGSNIQLNTNSLVTIDFNDKQRKLTLVRGEAHFDVAKDKNRPFTVVVGEKSFTALGTIFNVQRKNDSTMELVVTEGKVLIAKALATTEKLKASLNSYNKYKNDNNPNTPVLLDNIIVSSDVVVTVGEKAVIANNHTHPVEKISHEQVERDLAWQQGMLIFDGEPLEKALAEVSRYTHSTFEIKDDAIAKLKVAGYFKAGDIDGLLSSLAGNFNLTYQKSLNNHIILALTKTDS